MVDLPKIIPGIRIAKTSKNIIHVAVNTGKIKPHAEKENKGEKENKDLSESIEKHIELINMLIDLQLKNEHKVLTINLKDDSPEVIAALKTFLSELLSDERVHDKKIRVFIVGQWYEIDPELTEIFKEVMDKTKEYDQFFLNFCVNYDGQEEIFGAIRLIIRKILAEKIKEEELTYDSIKENIYTSYFPPPQLIIENDCSYSGLLLWDAKGAVIHYTKKSWLKFEKKDYDDAVNFFSRLMCPETNK